MINLRIHYLINGDHPRCGHRKWQNVTISPEKVTCETCKKLMKKELQS